MADSHATAHKVAHNITTIANIPLVAWVICSVFALAGTGYEGFVSWMEHPVNMIAAILFVAVTLKHFSLEIEVVVEDYVSKICVRKAIILMLKAFWLVLGLTAIISILKIAL